LRLPIVDWPYRDTPIRNRQLKICNHETHPLPQVVLTSLRAGC